MPRQKGSKNKPKTIDWHIRELKKLGHKFGVPETSEQTNMIPETQEKTCVSFVSPEKIPDDGLNLWCGACRKQLDREYRECPYCKAELSW